MRDDDPGEEAPRALGGQAAAMHPAHRQGEDRIRFDWGRGDAVAVAEDADIVVVVDVPLRSRRR